MGEILKMTAFLVVVCALSALALAFTDAKTRPLIEEQKRLQEEAARREVLPGAEAFEAVKEGVLRGLDGSGALVGYVGKTASKGFGGKVEILAGVDPQGRVTGVKVLAHTETPGLGTNAVNPKGPVIGSMLGRDAGRMRLKKDDPGGAVDAITGVTITSRAITEGVRAILEEMSDVVGR
jgi:electron transport complex protein RnfG